MTDSRAGGSAARTPFDATPEVQAIWQRMEAGLTTYLTGLPHRAVSSGQRDTLRLEVAGTDSGERLPSIRLLASQDGRRVRVAMTGDALLTSHSVHGRVSASLRLRGWSGNDDSSMDWRRTRPTRNADKLAHEIVLAMKGYGLPHPSLWTFRVSGPSSQTLPTLLPLVASAGVQEEPAVPALVTTTVVQPQGREHLRAMVKETLEGVTGAAPEVDGDGDLVVDLDNHRAWVRVWHQDASVMIFSRLVHGVHSRHATTTELALLNRDLRSFTLFPHEREVWMRVMLPACPYVPAHVEQTLTDFGQTVARIRGDLALRTRGEVG